MKLYSWASTLTLSLVMCGQSFASSFSQTNLVSDISGLASVTDPNLKDPWGVSFGATSPLWVSDRFTGVSTLYSGVGTIIPLVVTVPPGTSSTGPTGQVFAGGTNFQLNGNPAFFIFDTLGGTIDAWNGGASATVVATTKGANYTGLALANNTLYAANFTTGGKVNVFNSSYTQSATAGFNDPNLPAGYAPFNVQLINGKLYVEYAKVTPGVPVSLPGGGGFVDVFNTNGTLLQRLVSNGQLNAPWGVTLAPAAFGAFGGDLLVGNFGNGEINAFNPTTGQFAGTLTDSNGNPIVNSGLWAITFDPGAPGALNPDELFFTAGLNQGNDGLFGTITPVPEPAEWTCVAIGLLGLASLRKRRQCN